MYLLGEGKIGWERERERQKSLILTWKVSTIVKEFEITWDRCIQLSDVPQNSSSPQESFYLPPSHEDILPESFRFYI